MRLGGLHQGQIHGVFFQRLGLACEQNSPSPLSHLLVDVAVLLGVRQRHQRTIPVSILALEFEQRVHRPVDARIDLHGPLGELACRLGRIVLLRLQKQPTQAQHLGVGRAKHRLKDAMRRHAITGQLGGLRAQQIGQRLMRQCAARL